METSHDKRPSLAALGLLLVIQRRAGQRTTRADLAQATGRTVDSVDRLLRRLVADGLLEVTHYPAQPNVYRVVER